ncbi:MAG: hypothetical protein WC522_03795 [Candidatus Omnitrophota bacterium]
MEYPNLYKEQTIEVLDLPFMILKDDNGYMWEFPLRLTPPPSGWMIGDTVVIEPAGATRKGEDKAYYKVINKTRKQEAGAGLNNPSDSIKKNLELSDLKEDYANYDAEMRITKIEGELFTLEDSSKWYVYNVVLNPGLWKVGDIVTVARAIEKSKNKICKMTNIKTGKVLMAVRKRAEE